MASTVPALPPAAHAAIAAIQRAAKANGVAWQPIAAIDWHESRLNPSAVGDQGTSFGIDQEHQGGALPAGLMPAQAENVERSASFQARQVKALGIQNLPFAQQTYQISKRYERPTNVAGETQDANNFLRQYAAELGQGAPVSVPAAQPAPAPAAPAASSGLNAQDLGALQSSLSLTQQSEQRAMDNLAHLNHQSAQTVAPLDLTPYIDQVAQSTAAPQAPATAPQKTPVAQTPTHTTAVTSAGGFALPLGGAKFTKLGLPYQGTHSKAMNIPSGSNNWESENAIDLGTPVGTPIYAVQSGTIGSQIGPMGTGRFAGNRVHLDSANNQFYYAHLSKIAVKAGEHVQKGQLIGYSGEADGVAHLHIAALKGNPAILFHY